MIILGRLGGNPKIQASQAMSFAVERIQWVDPQCNIIGGKALQPIFLNRPNIKTGRCTEYC